MKIKMRGKEICIFTSDGQSFYFQKVQFKELYNALKIIKDLVNYESIDSIDADFSDCQEIYEL